MENCNPKLSQYFDSSYGKLQQEICLFIKGFPVIQMSSISSINDLIGMLIKQNSMLSTRFREQMGQIKDIYRKNEQRDSEVRKQQQQTEQLLTSREGELEEYRRKLDRAQKEIEGREADMARLAQQTSRLEETESHMFQLEAGIKELKDRVFSIFNEFLQNRVAKDPNIFIERFTAFRNQFIILARVFKSSKKMQQMKQHLQQQSEQFCELLIEKAKADRTKYKNEKQKNMQMVNQLDQMTNTVLEFTNRCRQTMKIFSLLPPQKIEKYHECLQNQFECLESNIKDIRERAMENSSNSKRTIDLKNTSSRTPLEQMLKSLASSMRNDTGCKNKQHEVEIETSKLKIKELTEKIKILSSDFEKAFDERYKKHQEELSTKDELLRYFQQNLIETKQRLESEQLRVDTLTKETKMLKIEIEEKQESIDEMLAERSRLVENIERAEQVIIHLEEEKNTLRDKLKESECMTDRKVVELVEELSETQKIKKNLVEQYEKDKMEILKQVDQQRRIQVELTQNLLSLKQRLQKENQQLQNKADKILELERLKDTNQNQLKSMNNLIKELENKIMVQATQLKNKEVHRYEQERMIKQLLSENQTNLVSLKVIKNEIPDVVLIRTCLDQAQLKLSKLTQENQQLKGLLKMAKTDISQSRKKITEFIEVDHDREMLRLKCQAYYRQITEIHDTAQERQRELRQLKEKLGRSEDTTMMLDKKKLEILALQAEISRLNIELKHSRNLVNRIQQLSEVL